MPGVGQGGRGQGAVTAAARAGLDEQSHSPAAHVEERSEQRCWGVGVVGLSRAVGALSVKVG